MEITKDELVKLISDEMQKNISEEKLRSVLNEVFESQKKSVKEYTIPEETKEQKEKKEDLNYRFKEFLKECIAGRIQKDVSGTYIIPTPMASELMSLTLGKSIFLQKAAVYTEKSGKLQVPYLDPTYMNPTNGYFGGLIVYSVTAGTNITESQAVFRNTSLVATGWGAYQEVPRTLLYSTSFNLNASLVDTFAEAIGQFVDYKCINGTGTTEPLGILQSNAKLAVNRANAGQVALIDLAGLYSKFLATQSEKGLVWIVHPSTFTYLLTLAAGNNWIFVDPSTKIPSMSLFGIPVMKSTNTSALGTAGDVILADLSAYAILLQEGISVYASEHYKFQAEVVAMKGIIYFDGQPLFANYATVGTSQYMSPYVYLN